MPGSRPKPVILVVDDEEPLRRSVRRTLEAANYLVVEAENGMRARDLLNNGLAVDLLLADLEMPELQGEEMARQLRGRQPDLKVLYVSGHIDRLLDDRPILWEGEAFLETPFTRAGLLEAVSMILFNALAAPR